VTDRSIVVRLKAEVSDFKSKMGEASKATSDVASGVSGYVQSNKDAINDLSNQVGIAGISLTGIATLAVAKFAEFDQGMSAVAATGDDAKQSIDALRAAALDAGAKTVYSATEAAGAIENLEKAGVSAKDILGGGLKGALNLAAAGAISVESAAEDTATALSVFGLSGTKATHVADLFAAGAGKAQGGVDDLAQAMNQSALVAKSTGLTIEETTAALAEFAHAGLIGSDAGTSFKTMLQRLTPQSDQAQQAMDKLGISAYDSQGKFIGLAKFAGVLTNALKDKSDEDRNSALATIFGSDAVRAANILYTEGEKGIRDWTAAVDDQGYAATTAATRLDNLKGDLEQLSGALDTALIQSGEGANGALRGLVQGVTDVVNKFAALDPEIQKSTLLLVGGTGLVLLGVAGLGKLTVAVTETSAAMTTLGISTERQIGLMKSLGAVAAVVATAAVANELATGIGKSEVGTTKVSALGDEIAKLGDKSAVAGPELQKLFEDQAAIVHFNDGIGSASQALDAFGVSAGNALGGSLNQKLGRLQDLGADAGKFGKQTEQLDEALASLASHGRADEAATSFQALASAAKDNGVSLDKLKEKFPQYAAALTGTKTAEDDLTGSVGTATAAQAEQAQVSEDAQKAMDKWRQVVTDADASFVDLQGSFAAVIDEQTALAQSAADKSKSSKDSWQDFYDGTSVSADQFIAKLQAEVDAQSAWETNMTDITDRVNTTMTGDMRDAANGMINELLALGPKGAATVQLLHDMSDPELAKVVGLYEQRGADAVNEFATKIQTAQIPDLPTPRIVSEADAVSLFLSQQQAKLNANPLSALVNLKVLNDSIDRSAGQHVTIPYQSNLMPSLKAAGGYMEGAGTSTSDSISARLSNGEYVIKASAVQQYGKGFFDNLNAQRFATGGQVGAATASAGIGAGDIAAAFSGMSFTLLIDGQPVRAIARAEAVSTLRTSAGRAR
jgi:TP901 family phage tail tape measure protein